MQKLELAHPLLISVISLMNHIHHQTAASFSNICMYIDIDDVTIQYCDSIENTGKRLPRYAYQCSYKVHQKKERDE